MLTVDVMSRSLLVRSVIEIMAQGSREYFPDVSVRSAGGRSGSVGGVGRRRSGWERRYPRLAFSLSALTREGTSRCSPDASELMTEKISRTIRMTVVT